MKEITWTRSAMKITVAMLVSQSTEELLAQ